MPIVLKLDDIMAQRRITLSDLAQRVGITNANLSHIKTGKARAIRFSTLERLCEALECKPGDIIDFIKDEPDKESNGETSDSASPLR